MVFLTDNGPQQRRYNGVCKDLKGTVHDGGIHVPCLVRWPGKWQAGRKDRQAAAHIDLAPTLLEACGVDPPTDVKFDGVSLAPLLDSQDEADVAGPSGCCSFNGTAATSPSSFAPARVADRATSWSSPEGARRQGDSRRPGRCTTCGRSGRTPTT